MLAMDDRDSEVQLGCPAMYYPAICEDRYLGVQCGSGKKPSNRRKWLCGAQGWLEGFGERMFWRFDTRTIESRFLAQWPCRALSALWKRKCAHFSCHRCMGKILLWLLHYFTTNQMLKCSRSPPISLPRDMMAFLSPLPFSFSCF